MILTCGKSTIRRIIHTKEKKFPQPQTSDLSIPFPTYREADVAFQTLRVDPEPSRSGVTKILSVESNILKVKFSAQEARKLRVGLTSFFDSLLLVTETMKEFGPPEPAYEYY